MQLVFDELDDPSPFSMVSRRLHDFSKAAYVRARYFLAHYGPEQAFFYALGRGNVLTEQVIDVRRRLRWHRPENRVLNICSSFARFSSP